MMIKVTHWVMSVVCGRSNTIPPHYHGNELGILYLRGVPNSGTPAGFEFWVYVYPEGTKNLPVSLLDSQNRVDMGINEEQLPSLLQLLNEAPEVHARYRVDRDGIIFGDVLGNFNRPGARGKLKKG